MPRRLHAPWEFLGIRDTRANRGSCSSPSSVRFRPALVRDTCSTVSRILYSLFFGCTAFRSRLIRDSLCPRLCCPAHQVRSTFFEMLRKNTCLTGAHRGRYTGHTGALCCVSRVRFAGPPGARLLDTSQPDTTFTIISSFLSSESRDCGTFGLRAAGHSGAHGGTLGCARRVFWTMTHTAALYICFFSSQWLRGRLPDMEDLRVALVRSCSVGARLHDDTSTIIPPVTSSESFLDARPSFTRRGIDAARGAGP